MDKRLQQLKSWLLDGLGLNVLDISPASADASFRRYFRVKTGDETYIAMDAPPQHEPLDAFIQINQALDTLGIHTPKIHHRANSQGFLLLEDLGNRVYLDELNQKTCGCLYHDALNSLLKLQHGDSRLLDVPNYSEELLRNEMDLFPTWYIDSHKQTNLNTQQSRIFQDTQQQLIAACLEQPQVWVHRDYHSRNLMITNDNSPGVIDFQDLVKGPISYDLASIFKDCYIVWPRQQQLSWLADYHKSAQTNLNNIPTFTLDELIRWYDLTGLQRHIKVLGIFCRLNYRDGKAQYLDDLPMVLNYVFEVCELYPELNNFKQLLQQVHDQS